MTTHTEAEQHHDMSEVYREQIEALQRRVKELEAELAGKKEAA